MKEIVESMAASAAERQREEVIDATVRITTAMYDAATRYTNVVIIAGYATYFALLASVKEVIPSDLLVWTAILMAISVTTFVAFEIYKMLYVAWTLQKRIGVFDKPGDVIALDKAYQEIVRKAYAVFVRIWVVVLVITIPTAAVAVGMLFWMFIRELVG